MTRRHLLPTLTLLFLSPLIGELLSGSAPPSQWTNPATIFFVVFLYGAGAILARELTVRWQKGFWSLILLGAAYGIIEEGLDVMSFFNAAWPDLNATAVYGRWAETNWVWAVHLTGYHAVFSIAIPILLTHLIFPQVRNERWLGCFGFAFFGTMLFLSAAGGNLLFRQAFQYSPPVLPYLGTILAVGLLVFAARAVKRPGIPPALEEEKLPHPIFYWLTGLLLTVAFFLCGWAIPTSPIPPVVDILLILGLAAVAMAMATASAQHGRQFTDGRKLALALGGLTFFLLLTQLLEMRGVDANTGESFAGMAFVGLIAALFFSILAIAVWRRERREARMEQPKNLPVPPRGIFH